MKKLNLILFLLISFKSFGQWTALNIVAVVWNSIRFLNPEKGFAAGNRGFILKNTNSGYYWSVIH